MCSNKLRTLWFLIAFFCLISLFVNYKPWITVYPTKGDVIQFVYFESEDAKVNFEFFLQHAVHDKADFVFIINGPSTVQIPHRENFKVIHRNNTCLDLGSHGEVAKELDLSNKYSRIILMNASVRGPFLPKWSTSCWSDVFFEKLDEKVKLVGTTANCAFIPHLQCMLLVFDSISLDIAMPLLKCHQDAVDAIENGEVQLTQLVRDSGYDALPIMMHPFSWDECNSGDLGYPGTYGNDGLSIHPFDIIFFKTKRFPKDYNVISHHSEWMNDYSSYEACSNPEILRDYYRF